MAIVLQRKLRRKAVRRRLTRAGFMTANVVVLLAVVLFVWHARSGADAPVLKSVSSSPSTLAAANPLDQVSSADIALTVSRMTTMSEATAIKNTAESDDVALSSAPATNSVVAKPEVVATSFKSNKDIQEYTVRKGDTVSSIARQFHVTSNSIRWSNGLSGDDVVTGAKLYIPPVGYSGIVYVVKKGDTISSLASRYNASKSELVAANDAELSGIHVGERIIIPGGQQPAPTYSSYNPYGGFAWGGSAIYGSNGYDFGYCTWWVAQRRAQVGDPLPSNLGNASSWPYIGQAAGLPEGNTPRLHAAAVTSTYGEGHVVFIEGVNPNGSVVISEMNHLGWDVTDTRTVSASEASQYIYIY